MTTNPHLWQKLGMPRHTEIAKGIHLVKAGGMSGALRMNIPRPLLESLKISNGTYLAVMAVGPCMVVAPIRDVTAAGATDEMRDKIGALILQWQSEENSK